MSSVVCPCGARGESVWRCLFVVVEVVVVVVVVVGASRARVRLVCPARQSQFWLPVGLWESEFVCKRILMCTDWFCVESTWGITVSKCTYRLRVTLFAKKDSRA